MSVLLSVDFCAGQSLDRNQIREQMGTARPKLLFRNGKWGLRGAKEDPLPQAEADRVSRTYLMQSRLQELGAPMINALLNGRDYSEFAKQSV